MKTTPNHESNPARHDPSQWLPLDAYELREVMAEEMASWLVTGFFTVARYNHFHRFAERLARLTRKSVEDVYLELRRDALEMMRVAHMEPHPIFRDID